MGEQERGVPLEALDELAQVHRNQKAKHDQARDAHQRIKQYHEMVTSEIDALLQKLHSAM